METFPGCRAKSASLDVELAILARENRQELLRSCGGTVKKRVRLIEFSADSCNQSMVSPARTTTNSARICHRARRFFFISLFAGLVLPFNEVALIHSSADMKASQRLGEAQAVRPTIIGQALGEIQRNAEVAEALFALLDLQATLKSPGKIIIAPGGSAGLLLNS
jgi:hypothetical protein